MTTAHPCPDESAHSDGGRLRAMFAAGADLLERHVETINGLNVFPVPDGDTGTNMLLTLRHMLSAADPGQASAGETAAVMARGRAHGRQRKQWSDTLPVLQRVRFTARRTLALRSRGVGRLFRSCERAFVQGGGRAGRGYDLDRDLLGGQGCKGKRRHGWRASGV